MFSTALCGQAAPSTAGGPDPAQVAELVTANHILAMEGVLDAYGHISVREKGHPDRFLLARAAPAGAVTAADIIEYDLDGNPIHPSKNAGYIERYIHAEVYKARPDVMSVVHSHAAEIIPFSVTSVPLRPMIHMAGFMPQQVPVFEIRDAAGQSDMLIRTPQIGHALAQTLGKNAMVLLRGHGAVVVGPSIHVVVGRAYYMTVDAKTEMQAIALGGGNVNYLTPQEAEKTGNQDGFERAWALWTAELARQK